MTSYASPHAHALSPAPAVPVPTLQEWTEAHSIADADRRRVALALLHDRLVASRMKPWEAALYLKRHVIGFVFRWTLMGGMALWVSPWMWVPIVGIPLYGLWQLIRHG